MRPWLNTFGIYDVRAIRIRTSKTAKGGNSDYIKFRNDIVRYLNQERDILITSFIDFFRLPNEFPNYQEAQKINSVEERIVFLEESIRKDINSERFTPYIQLHEFEALLFTDIKGFENIPKITGKQLYEILTIMANYPNPELINDMPQTAPSKRLERIIPHYNKVLHGNYIILDNTLAVTLAKCPRFKNWLQSLVISLNPDIIFE